MRSSSSGLGRRRQGLPPGVNAVAPPRRHGPGPRCQACCTERRVAPWCTYTNNAPNSGLLQSRPNEWTRRGHGTSCGGRRTGAADAASPMSGPYEERLGWLWEAAAPAAASPSMLNVCIPKQEGRWGDGPVAHRPQEGGTHLLATSLAPLPAMAVRRQLPPAALLPGPGLLHPSPAEALRRCSTGHGGGMRQAGRESCCRGWIGARAPLGGAVHVCWLGGCWLGQDAHSHEGVATWARSCYWGCGTQTVWTKSGRCVTTDTAGGNPAGRAPRGYRVAPGSGGGRRC